jgi:L-threonylcarbamoyladenylate synthase
MEILKLEDGLENAVARAREVLQAGGVIIYPTDTVYGLGCDAFSDVAVAKIYAIKGRDPHKPISCIVRDLDMAAEFGEVNDVARKLAEKFLPGPLTIILKKKEGVESGIARGTDAIGIRIPNNEFCLNLARSYGKPFTTTSANLSGVLTASTVEEILEQLGDKAKTIDLAVTGVALANTLPSTVVDVRVDVPTILRVGAIPRERIETSY